MPPPLMKMNEERSTLNTYYMVGMTLKMIFHATLKDDSPQPRGRISVGHGRPSPIRSESGSWTITYYAVPGFELGQSKHDQQWSVLRPPSAEQCGMDGYMGLDAQLRKLLIEKRTEGGGEREEREGGYGRRAAARVTDACPCFRAEVDHFVSNG